MTVREFIKEKRVYLVAMLVAIGCIEYYLLLFAVNQFLMIYIPIFIILGYGIPLCREYIKKREFYMELKKGMEDLEQRYLIVEILNRPSFLEGKIVYDVMKDINQNMMDEIGVYKDNIKEYKEYIELWVHEIKTPVTSAKLVIENNRSPILTSIEEEIEQMEKYIEQTLYYSRIDMVEKDYRIQKVSLQSLIYDCIKDNKKSLIANRFALDLHDLELDVYTDPQWTKFVMNQIIINAIKYRKSTSASLEIYAESRMNEVRLYITDTGIGIKLEEVSKVMEKGFVGTNGRKKEATTGMGLYICKKLLHKMHHGIAISSTEGEGTTVWITFPKNSYYM